MDVIKTKSLEYVYPDGTYALKGINIAIERGKKVAVIGANGTGKSTFLLHLNGILRPTKGEVMIEGSPIKYDEKSLRSVRKKVGIVFQDPDDQLFAPTVKQDVAFGPQNLDVPENEVERRVEHALKSVRMEVYADKPPHFLSAGQKKRVAIAGILAMEPEVLVLDEPTAGLDPQSSADIIEILDELNIEGKTIIFSTHDVDLAARWADYIYVFHNGLVRKDGVPSQIFADYSLISETGLRLPTFVQTFRELKVRGISGGDSPLTMLNFIESVSKPFDVLKVRCAVAGTDVCAGEKVGLVMRDGMLCTIRVDIDMNPETTAFGRVLYNARAGEDIVVGGITGTLSPKTGNIYIVPIPRVIEGGSRAADLETIRIIITEYEPHKIGAMGTSAKVVVRKAGIHCDFDVDVIQSSILAAVRGLNVMVFVTGGMVDRVIQKIEGHNKHSGQEIKFSSLAIQDSL